MYYNNDTILFIDGRFVKASEAKVDFFSQTLHYGYGVFEGIRAYQTVNGVKIFKAFEHYERLKHSAKLLGIPYNYDTEELIQATYQVLEKNNQGNAYIRPLLLCDSNMSLTGAKEATLMISTWEWGKYFGEEQLKICVSTYQRPNPKSTKIQAKACGHYVNSILASREAKERGFDEGLLLDMEGFVAEGPGANFFYEKDGILYTPPLGNILPGITRQTILEICKELDLRVVEKLFKPEDLFDADSAFFCGTAAEVTAIESIEGQVFAKPWKESMGAIIKEAYRSLVLDKSYSYVIV
ncbi:MAG: branched-chain amino acid transaminase [Cyclobacteriaceae bacterium]